MIIRCPQCEFSRSVSLDKVPPTSERATCPKCKHRFQFRTLSRPAMNIAQPPRESNQHTAMRHAGNMGQTNPEASRFHATAPHQAPPATQPNRRTIPLIQEAASPAVPPGAPAEKKNPAQEDARTAHAPKNSGPLGNAPGNTPSKASWNTPDNTLGVSQDTTHPDIWDAVDSLNKQWEDHLPPQSAGQKPTSPSVTKEPAPHAATHATPLGAAEPSALDSAFAHVLASADKNVRDFSSFPYTTHGGPPPEQRVDRDMEMLRNTSDRPTRDLGKLDDVVPPPDDGAARNASNSTGEPPASPRKRIQTSHQTATSLDDENEEDPHTGSDETPWENPGTYGWLRGFTTTLHGVLFSAPRFFANLTPSKSLGPGYLFFLLMGYLSIFGALIWGKVTSLLIDATPIPDEHALGLPVLLLLAPLAIGLIQMFITGCIRVLLLVFAPEKASFLHIFNIVSYAVAPLIFCIIPVVGPVIGTVWFLAALATGLRYGLSLSWQLAIPSALVPALFLVAGLMLSFL